MMTDLPMQSRQCASCGSNFRVLESSEQIYCTKLCGDNKSWAGQEKVWKDAKGRTVNVFNAATHRLNSANRLMRKEELKTSQMNKRKNDVQDPKPTMKNTKNHSTPVPQKESKPMQPISGELVESGTLEPEALEREQRLCSLASHRTCVEAASHSLNILKESNKRLLGLMDECVNESDIQSSKDGSRRVESHRIELAIKTANALATNIQAQALIVKGLADFERN